MSQPMNPYDSPEAPRPGMSGTAKVLIGLGIGCGVLVLLCCGIFGGGAFWFGKTMQNSLSTDPVKVRAVTEKIVTITIPDNLPPVRCMDVDFPLINTNFMSWAQYGDEESHNVLLLAQSGIPMDEESMRTQWRQSVRQNGRRDSEDIDIEQSEHHDQTVNGQPATFIVAKGKTHGSETEVWQVSGAFHGKEGPAILLLKVKAADFTKEQVLEILNSMK